MYIAVRGWQEFMNPFEADVIVDILTSIHSISRNGFPSLLQIAGGNLTRFCKWYVVPYRTAQNWLSGKRKAPEYTIMLLGYAVLSDFVVKYKVEEEE